MGYRFGVNLRQGQSFPVGDFLDTVARVPFDRPIDEEKVEEMPMIARAVMHYDCPDRIVTIAGFGQSAAPVLVIAVPNGVEAFPDPRFARAGAWTDVTLGGVQESLLDEKFNGEGEAFIVFGRIHPQGEPNTFEVA